MNHIALTTPALAIAITLALLGCGNTDTAWHPANHAPAVPPAGSGAGPDSPVAIELLAPGAPEVIEPSRFDTVRAIAEAENNRQLLLAAKRKEKGLSSVLPGDSEELRSLESIIRRESKLVQGIHLRLRVTNTSPDPIAIRYGPDTSNNTLRVDGPGTIYLPSSGAITADIKWPPASVIQPGGSREFPVRELRFGQRDLDRWLIGTPGVYSVRVRFTTRLESNGFDPVKDQAAPAVGEPWTPPCQGRPIDLTSNQASFTVQAGKR